MTVIALLEPQQVDMGENFLCHCGRGEFVIPWAQLAAGIGTHYPNREADLHPVASQDREEPKFVNETTFWASV